MKQATGELNMTVITVISIGILLSFVYTVVWPIIRTGIDKTVACKKATCGQDPRDDGTVECFLYDNEGRLLDAEPVYCTWKG